MRSVVIDGPDSWSQTLESDGTIEKFIGVDFSDADAVFDLCLTAIRKAQSVGFSLQPHSSMPSFQFYALLGQLPKISYLAGFSLKTEYSVIGSSDRNARRVYHHRLTSAILCCLSSC